MFETLRLAQGSHRRNEALEANLESQRCEIHFAESINNFSLPTNRAFGTLIGCILSSVTALPQIQLFQFLLTWLFCL